MILFFCVLISIGIIINAIIFFTIIRLQSEQPFINHESSSNACINNNTSIIILYRIKYSNTNKTKYNSELDVHSWFTRSFPFTYSTTLTPTLRLLSTCGGKVIHTLPHSILLHVHKEIGMLPGLKQLSTLFWSRHISCPKHVSWQFPAQSLGLGSTPFHFHPWG